MSEEKDLKNEQKEKPATRQIIIETNGNEIKIIKAEAAGKIELIAILESVVNHFKQN